jgi:hypothetical protein
VGRGGEEKAPAQQPVPARAVGETLRQVHPIRARGDGQGLVRSDEEADAAASGETGKTQSLFEGVGGAECPEDDGRTAGHAS